LPDLEENGMSAMGRLALTIVLAAGLSACAASLRNPRVADLRDNPARYQNHSVNIDGVVTTSWGVPLVPFRLYKVDDGTGEVTVVSQGSRNPTRGAKVRVRGRVEDVGVLGGHALGLHLREEKLDVKRR
jgi:hypothetical protein